MEKEEYEQVDMGFALPQQTETEIVTKSHLNKLDLREALIKRAVGFVSEEQIDEYAMDNLTCKMKLVKRKIVKKEVPPDVMAARMLVEVFNKDSLESMSDEELEDEKYRLLKLLEQNGGDNADRE